MPLLAFRHAHQLGREPVQQLVEQVGALEHHHVSAPGDHYELRAGDELVQRPRHARGSQDVSGAHDDQRGPIDPTNSVPDVKGQEWPDQPGERCRRHSADHRPRQLDIGR